MSVQSGYAATIPSAEFRLTSTEGLHVACSRWDSLGPVRGVVQIAHGMGEHIGRYVGTIEVLVSAGLTVYGNDHRGHGRTAPSAAHLGDFGEGGFDSLVEDMVRLSHIAKEEIPDAPFMLLGHGMGSFAAQQFGPAKPLSLAIVLTPLRRRSANISKAYNWPKGCTLQKALSPPASSKSQPLHNEMKIHSDSTALTQGA